MWGLSQVAEGFLCRLSRRATTPTNPDCLDPWGTTQGHSLGIQTKWWFEKH